jgi:hypothetical protein
LFVKAKEEVRRMRYLLGNHFAFSRPHGDLTSLQTDEAFLFINENESIRTLKVVDQLGVVSQDVMDFEGFVLLLYQDVLIELLHKLYVLQVTLIGYVHQRFPCMHIDDSHGNRVVHWVEKEKHDAIAREELGKKG